jgi:hypothetical protein
VRAGVLLIGAGVLSCRQAAVYGGPPDAGAGALPRSEPEPRAPASVYGGPPPAPGISGIAVEGGLAKDPAVRHVVHDKRDALMRCCNDSTPAFRVRAHVAADGNVVRIDATGNECATKELQSLRFNRASSPSVLEVSVRCR